MVVSGLVGRVREGGVREREVREREVRLGGKERGRERGRVEGGWRGRDEVSLLSTTH